MAIIECIPNISEGRRQDVLDACADAIRKTGARLLDVKSDSTHNRAVYTFAGTAEAVRAGVMALYGQVIPAIDLRQHKGEHPRLGAVDVVPFVPIEGVTMADCVALAKQVAADVAREYQVPVFLLRKPRHRRRGTTSDIRRGEFEAGQQMKMQPGSRLRSGRSHRRRAPR